MTRFPGSWFRGLRWRLDSWDFAPVLNDPDFSALVQAFPQRQAECSLEALFVGQRYVGSRHEPAEKSEAHHASLFMSEVSVDARSLAIKVLVARQSAD